MPTLKDRALKAVTIFRQTAHELALANLAAQGFPVVSMETRLPVPEKKTAAGQFRLSAGVYMAAGKKTLLKKRSGPAHG